MSKAPTASQLEKLEKKRAQLQAQIQNLKARDRSKSEKEETRRKILVGAYTLDQAREKGTYDKLVASLDSYLTRNSDRVLFGLHPLKSETPAGAAREAADVV